MEELSGLQLGYFQLSRGKFSEANNIFSSLIAAGEESPTVFIGKLLSEEQLTEERQLPDLPRPLAEYSLFEKAKDLAGKGYLATLSGYEEKQRQNLAEKADKYQKLTASEGKSAEELTVLAGIATELGAYRDASAYKEEYLSALSALEKEKSKRKKRKRLIAFPILAAVLILLVACGMVFSLPSKDGIRYGLTLNGFEVLSADDSFTEVVLPEKVNGIRVTGIGNSAFEDCKKLKKVTFNGQITSVGRDAFAGCTALEEIENSETVLKIDKRAFEKCKTLAELRFAEGCSFKKSSFRGCDEDIEVFGGERKLSIITEK